MVKFLKYLGLTLVIISSIVSSSAILDYLGMSTMKIVGLVILLVLAFIWGAIGGANEKGPSDITAPTYIGGSCIAAVMSLLIYYLING